MSSVDDASAAHSSNSRSSSAHNNDNDSADEDARDNSDNRVVLSLKDKGENTVVIFSKQYLDAVTVKTVKVVDIRSEAQIAFDKHKRVFQIPIRNKPPFDFFDDCDKAETKTRHVKYIPPDYFNANGAIRNEICQQRCTQLNLSAVDPRLLSMARREIEADRDKCLDHAVNRLEKLTVLLAEEYRIKLKSGGKCTNCKSICQAFGEIDTDKKAEVFWHVYYGMWDIFKDWQGKLELYLLYIMDWSYDPEMMLMRGKTKCCCYRLASEAANLLRKQLNSYGKRNCSRQLTIKRPKHLITAENKYDKRAPNVFMPYYIKKVC